MSPCHYYGYLDPTSVENRIWDDRIGTSRCDAGDSRLLSGAMLEACGQGSLTSRAGEIQGICRDLLWFQGPLQALGPAFRASISDVVADAA
jgi:hypothetical protein